jgi:hypothetical protein
MRVGAACTRHQRNRLLADVGAEVTAGLGRRVGQGRGAIVVPQVGAGQPLPLDLALPDGYLAPRPGGGPT